MVDPERKSFQADQGRTSAPGLLTEAFSNVSSLMRSEMDLARVEMQENVTKAVVAIGLLVAAVVASLVALNVLAGALTAALVEAGLEAGWAALIVGVAFAVIALVMALKGKNDLSGVSLAPTRTAKNVRRDANAIKETVND